MYLIELMLDVEGMNAIWQRLGGVRRMPRQCGDSSGSVAAQRMRTAQTVTKIL